MSGPAIFQEIRAWLFDDALPIWADRGVDRQFGGFVEALNFDGRDARLEFKRTRVSCRQIYVFSHAKMLGFTGAEALIAPGVQYLTDKAWRANGGFARRLTRRGAILDATPDLYDNAFALFAFAWAFRATGDALYRDWAQKTFDWIDANMRHPSGKGFWHAMPPEGWRLQNPHMHLLEASLVAFEATQDEKFRACGTEIAGLFRSHFFNPATKTLAEYFTDDLARAPGEEGRIAEPGHQLEWIWILENCNQRLGLDGSEEIRALAAFCDRFGVNAHTGAVMNAVRDDGEPLDAGSRTWPNTERLKAAVALFERNGADPLPTIESTGRCIIERYLTPNSGVHFPKGGWIDAIDDKGKPVAHDMPASTLYHVFMAFAEVLRIENALRPAR